MVFKRPLPYLYLAPDTLGAAGVPYRVVDALPLAAEPVVATVDLVLDAVETRFARDVAGRAARARRIFAVADDGATDRLAQSIAR